MTTELFGKKLLKTMNTKLRSLTILVFILFLIIVLFFSPIKRPPVVFESGYRLVMGTFARVIIVAPNAKIAEKAAADAFAAIESVDDLMNDYDDNSEIGIVNKEAFQREVQVSESTFEVIQRSIEFSKLTDGSFDVTIGPLSALFRKAKQTQIAPSWLGAFRGSGHIVGDIISPVSDELHWEVLEE